ncbi:MAG TPA: hypothetical protein PKJ85_12690 [Nitrosomonas nitrosa]|nr:hypothetical protein [Nitrosomonas nitrosa]
MKRLKYGVVFISCLIFVACASNERKTPEIQEEFVTKIEQNDLKLFTYTVVMTMPEGERGSMRRGGGGMRGGGTGSGMGGGMRGGGMGSGMAGGMRGGQRGDMQNGMKRNREDMINRMKERFFEKLDEKMAETGYCREGYTVLDNYFIKGRAQIRGECKDSATKEDRLMFSMLISVEVLSVYFKKQRAYLPDEFYISLPYKV